MDNQISSTRSTNEHVGVILIHGIGNQQPGVALHALTDALDHHPGIDIEFTAAQQRGIVEELPLEVPDSRNPFRPISPDIYQFYAAHERAGTTNERQYTFVEAFWADASKLRNNWLGALQGLLNLFVGVNVVIDSARPQPAAELSERAFQRWDNFNRTALVVWALLAGPLFALSILMLSLYVVYYVFGAAPDSTLVALPLYGVPILIGLIFNRSDLLRNTARSLLIAGGIGLLLSLLLRPTVAGHSRLLVGSFSLLFVVAEVTLWLLIAGHFLHSLYCWMTPVEGESADAHINHANSAAVISIALQYGLWLLIIPIVWRQIIDIDRMPVGTVFHTFYRNVLALDGPQWVVAGLWLAALLFAYAKWNWRTALLGSERPQNDRLIINNVILWTVLGSISVVLLIPLVHNLDTLGRIVNDLIDGPTPWVLYLFQSVTSSWVVYLTELIYGARAWVSGFLGPITLLLSGSVLVLLLSFALQPTIYTLDLLNDIITYLKYNKLPPPRRLTGQIDTNNRDFLRIRKRLSQTIQYLRDKKQVDRIVIVSHSQGTIVSVDELANPTEPVGSVTLVTLGTPLTHIYQHYFPFLYRTGSAQKQRLLNARISRWVNFYRSDDIVGRTVSYAWLPIEQTDIGPGGHFFYWRDPKVVGELIKIFGDQ